MTVLRGYTNIGVYCGICGEDYIAIESTGDPEVVKLRCWCGSTCMGPRDDSRIVAALGPVEPPDNAA